MNIETALVIAPHADDETFGCGGTIAKLSSEGVKVNLLLGTLGNGTTPEQYSTRKAELDKAVKILGINDYWIMRGGEEGKMDMISQVALISFIEDVIKEEMPDVVFIPYPSHHQDHIAIHRACMAALRPGTYQPKMILMYEYTYPTWEVPDQYNGRFFVDITSQVMKKFDAIGAYKSQLHPEPSPVSIHASYIMAETRGLSIGVTYAEMFYVIQMRDVI